MAATILASATPGSAQSTGSVVGDLIQCPDWQRYAPPVVPVVRSEGQTAERFADRVAPEASAPDASAAPKTPARRTPNETCQHTVVPSETFGTIALKRLGTSRRWQEIQQLNPTVDPNRLVIGTTLTLPCAAPDPAATPEAGSTPSFFARLFGPRPGSAPAASERGATAATAVASASAIAGPGTSASAAASTAVAPPSAPAEPVAPLVPVWSANDGEFLSDVLTRWGRAAGWTVVIDTTEAWEIGVPLRFRAEFEDAVAELVRGLGHGGTPPRVRLYSNQVILLGGPI